MPVGDRFVSDGIPCEVVWSGGSLQDPEAELYGCSSLVAGVSSSPGKSKNARGNLTTTNAPRAGYSEGSIFGFRGVGQ